MTNVPKLLPSSVKQETYAGYNYFIDGELVPVLTVELYPGQSVYFEHHILLWKNCSINIGIKPLKGLVSRMLSGMQVFVTEATGAGKIAFSRDQGGQIIPLHLKAGQMLEVREHQFLAATSNVSYSYKRLKGLSNIFLGGSGFFVDKFQGDQQDGILWLHGYGNVFEITLEAGEQIDVEPGAWLYKDASVQMQSGFAKLSTGLFASTNISINRFTGPGRLGIQSMSLLVDTGAPQAAGLAGVINNLINR